MHEDLSELTSVGFRHVVEDGLAILEGRAVPAARRQFVLEDLARIAQEAGEVSSTPPAGLFRASDRDAHLVFSLLIHRAAPQEVAWGEWLQRAAQAFRALLGQAVVLPEDRDSAHLFLQEVLASIRSLPAMSSGAERDEGFTLALR